MTDKELTTESSSAMHDEGKAQESVLQQAAERLTIRRKIRHIQDKMAQGIISFGGISVIITILLIFAYLFYEVFPLFESAELEPINEYVLATNTNASTLHTAIEEQGEIAMRLDSSGSVHFFDFEDGNSLSQYQVDIPDGVEITSHSIDTEESGIIALGLSNGQVQIIAHEYDVSFRPEDNARVITPQLTYPFGEEPYTLFEDNAVVDVALRTRGENMTLAALDVLGRIQLLEASKQTSLFAAFDDDDGGSFEVEFVDDVISAPESSQILIDGDRRWLFVASDNGLVRIADLRSVLNGEFNGFEIETFLTEGGERPTQVSFLLGGISLLVADESGAIGQWFITRQDDQTQLSKIRSFDQLGSPLEAVTVEQRRKNFVAGDTGGNIAIYNTTAHRAVFSGDLLESSVAGLALAPRGDALLIESEDGGFSAWEVHNEHPEVSWTALWNQVWYEGYSEPDFIWQSSAATNEFEPKYSLVPLSFGTLKAAFYAMLLAAPLAICGAIFTGYFMAPAMRGKVKPLIELMEALPTVVLGFLAGLWLAPFVEQNLLGIFSILIILPLSILLASLGWMFLPKSIRHAVPDGWEAAILIPVILVFGFLSFAIAAPIETLLFDGDIRFWITNEMGIAYDQRNAMVVGFAMGFAVIPTVFSIAEDAIFTVPRHLSYGSLALGATPWQSLVRVVLPTASPGIFSGLMIGLGRAVGETMIVLMATGNTPIMDINIFEGMRTLAANIAVEIPESEVDSTHYRILFLAALVLFMFTFIINTVAEIVRQRLRSKYSTI